MKDHRGSGHCTVISRADGGAMPLGSCFQTTTELPANIFRKLWHKDVISVGQTGRREAVEGVISAERPTSAEVRFKHEVHNWIYFSVAREYFSSHLGDRKRKAVALVVLVYLPSLIALEFCPSCALDSDIVQFRTNLLCHWWLWWTRLTCCALIPSLFFKTKLRWCR